MTELLTNMTRGLICFKALLHETFKAYGVLFIDAQFEPLRKWKRLCLKDFEKTSIA